jgi:hypothetical protein
MPIAMLSTSLLTNPQKYGRFNALDTENPFAAPGMVLINPTSIANSGGSATLGANGQVTFSAVNSVSLNGCFTADFDNYIVSMWTIGVGDQNLDLRVRASGTDNTTASSYVLQYLDAANTVLTASRTTAAIWAVSGVTTTTGGGATIYFYGPFLEQPTAMRTITSAKVSAGSLLRYAAGTHNQTTSYDGFTVSPNSGTVSGALQVYGVRS